MIKEIVEFMDLEGGKFRDIILENRAIAKGLHIIIDKDSFEIKEFAYNDGSDEFNSFVNKYDLKKREYYCNYLDSNKNFDTSPMKGKNQIHSASPYAIFFRYKNDITLLERLLEIKKRVSLTGYFEKITSLTEDKEILKHLNLIEKIIKSKLSSKYFIKSIEKKSLLKIKSNDYIKIYFDYDLAYIENFYNEYSPEMSFNAKGLFEDKNSYSTTKKYNCPVSNEITNLGTSSFLNTYADKKPFYLHKTRDKTYGGYTALYTGKVVQRLSLFEELLKLKIKVDKYEKRLFPNPLPIFISNKDAIDNDGNKLYFDLLKEINEPIGYQEIIKKAYEKIAGNNDEIRIFYCGNIDTIFNMEWGYFSKFFYTLNGDNENTYMLQNNYFTEKINVPQSETIPAMVATKFYQYNKAIFDYIYKGKLEVINGYMFDDICISIIREQIKLNDDWDKTYKIEEKLALYLSLHKNFHKGEDLATQIIELNKRMEQLIENEDTHLINDGEFAFASGQLIWFILYQNQSSSKTHSLLDIFISKNRIDDFKIVITQNIQKYSHAFKFFNNKNWFDKLASEVLAYELEQKTIKSLIPLIMAGYFSKNIILSKIGKKSEENKKQDENGDTDGK